MRSGVVDWLVILGVIASAIAGAVLEKESDGKITQIIMYSDINETNCKKKEFPKIYLGK